MTRLLLIGLGGFVGALARYFISGWVQQLLKNATFPYGTLAVNLSGCLLIGLLSYLADARGTFSADTRALLFVGLMGAYTTYSTFGNETLVLIRNGESGPALVNVGAHITLGLGAVWAGRWLAGLVWK